MEVLAPLVVVKEDQRFLPCGRDELDHEVRLDELRVADLRLKTRPLDVAAHPVLNLLDLAALPLVPVKVFLDPRGLADAERSNGVVRDHTRVGDAVQELKIRAADKATDVDQLYWGQGGPV